MKLDKFINKVCRHNANKIIIDKLKNYQYVSFDIFDTLIKRDAANPQQVFEMISYSLENLSNPIKDFTNQRLKAELIVRKNSTEQEITLEEIYDELAKNNDSTICNMYKTRELDVEFSLCQINKKIKEVYDWCVLNKKIIIIISDMYLPQNLIEKILFSNGYQTYCKLYLSSKIKKTKSTGDLYSVVIKDLGIKANEIIHIGDNFKSDYKRAKEKGLESIHINEDEYSNILFDSNHILPRNSNKDYKALSAFINNHCIRKADNFYYQIGFETLGPILMGFIRWLNQKFKENNLEKIYFLARDGKIFQNAYSILNAEHERLEYMYASRRALIVPTLWMCKTLDEVVATMFLAGTGTISTFLDKIGLKDTDYKKLLNSFGYSINRKYVYKQLFREKNFNRFFEKIKYDMHQNSKSEFNVYVAYLKQIDFKGRIAVIDIGWHGNMQKALQKICAAANLNVEIYGYYLGLNPSDEKNKNPTNAYGYLFDTDKNYKNFKFLQNFISILEMMCTASHGSVKRILLENGKFYPDKKTLEYIDTNGQFTCEYYVIQQIQEGAINFITDVTNEKYFKINWNPNVVFQNLILLGLNPNTQIANEFGNCRMMDDEFKYIARPDSLTAYITKPSKYFSDLHAAYWKIGFKKRLFKINLIWYKLMLQGKLKSKH